MKKRKNLLLAGAAVALVLAMPAAASAEIRTGTATDLIGDSLGATSQDFVGLSAQYDTNGQATVTATMNGDIASGPASFFSFAMASYAAPSSCMGTTLSMFGFSDSSENLVMVTGVKGTGSHLTTVSGNSITFGAGGTALQNKDWTCVTATVSDKVTPGILDRFTVPLYFNGYGPDTDGDGLKDNQDQCPTVSGPAPTGCPPAPAPVVKPPVVKGKGGGRATCSTPKLKGKTLAQAKSAISSAHCTLGKVTKPKRKPKKAKLVVTSSRRSGNQIDLTLGVAKRKRG